MKYISGKLSLSAIVLFFFLGGFSSINFAQDLDDVIISGKITDSDGAAIVGATVTATQVSTGVERSVVSGQKGRYRLIELTPGVYTLKVAVNGFAVQIKTDLETISGQSVKLDFLLSPATVTAEQTVSIGDADAPLIDTTRTVVGGTITEREIEELPNTTRDVLDFVFTLGGVTEEPLSTRDLSNDKGGRDERAPRNSPEEVGVFALSGGAAYSNNITIDGFDNNDDRVAGFRFQPSVENVREVQVITNQFSAEYGRASGGRVNILTKAGGRKFKGRAYYFFRDDNLNANSWSNNKRQVARPPFQQNVHGVTIGGPVQFGYFKDKTFFYAGYEYDYIADTTVTDTYIPLVQNPNFPLPEPNANEVITDFANTIWATDLGRFVVGVNTPRQRHKFTTKIDHNFNDYHYFTVNYQYGKTVDKRQFNGGNRLSEALIGKLRNTNAINLSHNYIFNANAVNNFKVQYSTLKPQNVAAGQFLDPVVLISFREPGRSFNTTLVSGSSTLGSSARDERRWQIQETFNYVAGSNTFRAGFDIQNIDSTNIDLTDASGTFNFQSPLTATTLWQCLLDPNDSDSGRIRSGAQAYQRGCVTRYRQNFFTDSTIKNIYYGVFFQNEWRVFSNFSLNFGTRYEQETVIRDKNNIAPRFAFAWAPFKNNKGVIRFGAGIFYNRVLLRTVDDFRRGQTEVIFDTNRITSQNATRDPYLQTLSDGFPNVLTADSPLVQQYVGDGYNNNEFFRSLDPTLKIPESYQVNLGFEREIGDGMVFEANLTYNRTARLWRERNTNAPVIPAGFADLADYLVNGLATGNTRFEFGPVSNASADDRRIEGGITYWNLNYQDNTTAFQSPYGQALAIARTLRPDQNAGQTEQVGSLGNSWYRGLVLELRRRYRKLGLGFGSSMRLVYTLSYLEDDGIVNTSNAQIQGDFASERSRSLLDRRHRFVLSGLFDVPKWLGGLRFSPIFKFGSSAPFNLSNGGSNADDRNLDDVNTDRPNYSGNLDDLVWRRDTEPLNPNILNNLTLAAIGRAGNLPRNAGTGPRQYIFDLNISRQFKFGERMRLRPQIEINNILNMTVFSYGSEFIDASTITDNPAPPDLLNFLVPTRSYRPRKIRIGVRFDF